MSTHDQHDHLYWLPKNIYTCAAGTSSGQQMAQVVNIQMIPWWITEGGSLQWSQLVSLSGHDSYVRLDDF